MQANIETAITKELADLQRQDGSWAPEDVVEYAREHKQSALHSRFNWNKNEAAMEHWLLTARNLIKKYVIVYEPRSKDVAVSGRVYSVPSRRGEGGSYVSESAIAGNEAWREETLKEVQSILRTMKLKYASLLPELKAVWKAIK